MPREGLIFTDESINAFLAGRKLQTRRIIPPTWARCLDLDDLDDRRQAVLCCPYGKVGSPIYAKEAWAENDPPSGYIYRADWPHDYRTTWKTPLFMPKKVARLWFTLVDVRIQPLQEITRDDAIAEGVAGDDPIAAYRLAWSKLHGSASWDQNPYVWALTLKRMTKHP